MDMVIGLVVLAVALGVIVGLVLHGRGVIDRIARAGGRSARQALRDMHGGD